MPAATAYGYDLELALGVGRTSDAATWGTDKWAAAVWYEPDTELGDWIDVTCQVPGGVHFEAGSDDTRGVVVQWEAATCSFELDGDTWDPWNGPYAGAVGPQTPVRWRWRLTGNADWLPLFYGAVADGGWQWDPRTARVAVACVDQTSQLAGYDAEALEVLVGAGDTAAQRVGRILDMAQWPADARDVTAGGVALVATDLAGGALEQLQTVADTDLAAMYIDRAGVLVYRPQGRVNPGPSGGRLVVCPPTIVTPGAVDATNRAVNPIGDSAILGWWASVRASIALNPGFFRMTITDATAGNGSQRIASPGSPGNRVDCVAGDVLRITCQGRSAQSHPVGFVLQFLNSAGTQVGGSLTGPANPTNPTSFTQLGEFAATAPATTAYANMWIGIIGTGPRAIGDTFDVCKVLITVNTVGVNYFDGDTAATETYVYGWTGTPQASTSERRPLTSTVDTGPIQVVDMSGSAFAPLVNSAAVRGGTIPATVEGEDDYVPPYAVASDAASIARYRVLQQKYDLLHDATVRPDWSQEVATLTVTMLAWPTAAPHQIVLDVVSDDLRVPGVLFGLEPDTTFTVTDTGGRDWIAQVAGWDVQAGFDYCGGTLFLADLTSVAGGAWGTARWGIDRWGIGKVS